jgi:hypothetical protein
MALTCPLTQSRKIELTAMCPWRSAFSSMRLSRRRLCLRNICAQPLADGRPNSLNSKRFVELLKAIAEENSKNQTFITDDGIAGKLIGRPEYQDLSPRQLRRKVGQAIDWEIDQLKTISPDRWNDFFGIAPPQKMTRQFLRAKAFEHLRNELGRHNESMAKKP